MKPRTYHKTGAAEIRLYEWLGVRLFRKVVLLVERIKHRTDGGQNENYHLQDTSQTTLRRFSGYLLYNAAIHVISLLFTIAYFIVTRCFSVIYVVPDIVMIVVAVLNVYCLLLQRYSYLRIRQRVYKKQQTAATMTDKRVADVVEKLDGKPLDDTERDIRFLQALRESILSETDRVLIEAEEDVLLSIAAVCDGCKKKTTKRTNEAVRFSELVAALPANARVVSKVQQRVGRLQTMLRFDRRNTVFFGVCLATSTPTVEAAYQTIFPSSALDAVLETIDVLLTAYHTHRNEVMS